MAATAAASIAAKPSTTSGTARGLFRNAIPKDVSVVNAFHAWPYGVASSKGHAPTEMTVPTTTSRQKKVRWVQRTRNAATRPATGTAYVSATTTPLLS